MRRSETQRGRCYVKTESWRKDEGKIGVMLPQAKGHLGLKEAGRGKERPFGRYVKGRLVLLKP